MEQSRNKLNKVSEELRSCVPAGRLNLLPCSTDEEALSYRCRCSFQLAQGGDSSLRFAVRHDGQPVIIDTFPVANRRIRQAMAQLLLFLNDTTTSEAFTQHLDSVSFASSWSDKGDCVVTCHYGRAVQNDDQWIDQAQQVCSNLNLCQLFGRSRKHLLAALPDGENVLRDQLLLRQINEIAWSVCLLQDSEQVLGKIVVVNYEKPSMAFYHPNSNVMLKALQWQLERISTILSRNDDESEQKRRPALLELYCGCGAHTVALAKSRLVSSIVAVELDSRLVTMCERNLQLNQLGFTEVTLISEDAGVWADDSLHSFDILLVDPPKQGLADSVCKMAVSTSSCRDIIYISCGYEALMRDLILLGGAFDIVDCTVVDLFPTMEGVESLVHLSRKD
jgi:tRNA/tmRNA/rRNA uracil-C5-methylase (TrmA/RlmC/RlmD family)